jgi:DNA polymerase-1
MTYLTEDEFNRHLINARQSPYLAVDTEGTLNHPFSTTWGASTSAKGMAEYFAFNHKVGNNLPQSWLPRLKEVIESHPCLIFHHAKHDLRSLRSMGINYTGKFYDIMLMQHMIDENVFSKSLDSISRMYGGDPKKKTDEMQRIIDVFGWDAVPLPYMRFYGANDGYITEQAFYPIYSEFCNQGFDGELWQREQEFVRFLANMEDNGILINQELSERELERGLKIMKEIENSLGFNPGSPKQLGKFLLEDLGLPVLDEFRSKRTNNPSFNKDAMKVYDELLQRTNDKRAEQVLIYRGWAKTTSSNYRAYLELLHKDGRLRPNFKMHGTRTGRLSCEHPNLQQIPRESANDWNGQLKRAFITDAGRTAWEVDYSQLEFRLGAAYGKVPRLIELFSTDRDVFSEMAKDLGMGRQDCKTLTYLLQFGGGVGRICEVFGVSNAAGRAIKNNFFNNYDGLARVANLAETRAKQNGYVKYWTGRRRHFPYSGDCRKAFNATVQGGAFEIVKRATLRLDKEGINSDECRIDLQVHDSLRFDIENGKEQTYLPEIIRVMEDVQPDFGVKFRVDIKKWGEK